MDAHDQKVSAVDLSARLAAACAAADVPGAGLSVRHPLCTADAWYGVADRASSRAVDQTTRFRIASITKVFTAALLVRAAQAGHLALDDELGRWFDVTAVTLRQLANHTSGLLGDFFPGADDGPDALAGVTRALVAAPRLHAPGHVASYGNAGFVALGAAIECATGRTWEELVLDLAPTLRVVAADDPDVAVLHGSWWPLDRSIAPAGSTLVGTAAELVDALVPLQDPALGVMQQPSSAFPQPSMCQSVGLGWWIDDRGARRVLSHSGGGISLAVLVPEVDLRLAFVSNGPGGRAVVEGLVQQLLQELAGVPPVPPHVPDGGTPTVAPGRFTHGDFSAIELAESSLVLEPSGLQGSLRPLSRTAFLADVAGQAVPVPVSRDADGTDLLHLGGRAYRRS
jgi:CubicO group peptidase (beta-lactamase class C family)